jgi:very-short-patch-repair endonuclease
MISGAARVAPKKAVFRPALPMSFSPGISEMQMSELRKIEPNVWAFLYGAADLYGRIKAREFSDQMYTEMIELGIESPIEDMVYIALNLQCEARSLSANAAPDFVDGSPFFTRGVQITPQTRIGKYRVDFCVFANQSDTRALVELDGHNFHDKDKRQRSYEKARDRHFVKAGYQVLHYTGSDVFADPYCVAFEILEVLGVLDEDEQYDSANPVGFE